MKQSIILFIYLLGLISCTDNFPKYLLYDFESIKDLNDLYWKCHTEYSLSDKFATQGKKSLKIDFYPADYTVFSPVLRRKNWDGYQALCFDIYNPDSKSHLLLIRIDDKENAQFADRFNSEFICKPGYNHICKSFEEIVTSRDGRQINMKRIKAFLIFQKNITIKYTFYLDNIYLQK